MSKLPLELINKILFEFKGLESPTASIIKNVIIELNEDNGVEENQETLTDMCNMSEELIFNRERFEEFETITRRSGFNDYVDYVVKRNRLENFEKDMDNDDETYEDAYLNRMEQNY